MSKTTAMREMLYRTLGSTGEKVSAIGIGGWHIGLNRVDEQLSIRIMRTAIDRGINFMDNCWDYNEGASEIRMGKALRDGYRDKVFLMTKIDGRSKHEAARQRGSSIPTDKSPHNNLNFNQEVKTVVRLSTSDRVIFQHGGKMNAMADIRNNDGRTILIVEDNDELRETLSEWLKSVFCDCTFQVAGSGEKAIELAEAHRPVVVIMDFRLPRMNGIEAIRHIKMISPKTQAVLLTVINGPECIDVAMAAGACTVVKKQHMHVELIPVLTKILSQEITEGEKA